ncbi:site-specific integrase [Lysinibacillus sp. FSL K6-1151]|uniref:site-specific integrase n=1 Tax=Lysinibacillus sp. FSL K6-1151 TaxID=2921465 RepID=UPI00315ADEEF
MAIEVLDSYVKDADIESTNNFRISDAYDNQMFEDIFYDQIEQGNLITTDYNSLTWNFYYKTRQTPNKFDFNKINIYGSKKLDETVNIELVLKAWVLSNISDRSIESLKKYFDYTVEFLLMSDFFSKSKLDFCNEFLMSNDDRKRWNLCIPILNLLDFLDNSSFDDYYKLLIQIKASINVENVSGQTRELPNVKDVLVISQIVDNFENNLEYKSDDYYVFFPIILWWKLTNIIPMRPSEFVSINKNALSIENGKFYISLPRIKIRKNSRRIQIVNKIAIPEEIYTLIKDYLFATNNDNERNNLFSVKGISKKLPVSSRYLDLNYEIMSRLLNRFYDSIVTVRYKAIFEEKVRLNDTRHFAFINLMRQGYHPVEIARLGGHTSLQAQYHYQQHLDYWVEFETLQLLYSTSKSIFDNDGGEHYPINIDFILNKVVHPIEPTYKAKLELGYCTDPLMLCRTKDCINCPNWGIDLDEFNAKKNIIKKRLQELESNIDKALTSLKKLYEITLNDCFNDDEFSNLNPLFQKELFNARLKLDEEQSKLSKFKYNILKGKIYAN